MNPICDPDCWDVPRQALGPYAAVFERAGATASEVADAEARLLMGRHLPQEVVRIMAACGGFGGFQRSHECIQHLFPGLALSSQACPSSPLYIWRRQ